MQSLPFPSWSHFNHPSQDSLGWSDQFVSTKGSLFINLKKKKHFHFLMKISRTELQKQTVKPFLKTHAGFKMTWGQVSFFFFLTLITCNRYKQNLSLFKDLNCTKQRGAGRRAPAPLLPWEQGEVGQVQVTPGKPQLNVQESSFRCWGGNSSVAHPLLSSFLSPHRVPEN